MTGVHPRLEPALREALARLTGGDCPPRLAQAIEYAVFPPGNRLRPRLCYAVADALGDDAPSLTDRAAVALEFLHGASLVQDDLPAFDDAPDRRGRPALHRVFGEALAVLAADALIIGAFEHLGDGVAVHADRAQRLISTVAHGVGSRCGAVAGQAWESESHVDLERYHRAKTAALFEAATGAGAVAAGHDPRPWQAVGSWLGRAYQIADDMADGSPAGAGGSDATLGRPNALRSLGPATSIARFEQCAARALAAVPCCTNRGTILRFLDDMLRRFHPAQTAPRAAAPVPVSA